MGPAPPDEEPAVPVDPPVDAPPVAPVPPVALPPVARPPALVGPAVPEAPAWPPAEALVLPLGPADDPDPESSDPHDAPIHAGNERSIAIVMAVPNLCKNVAFMPTSMRGGSGRARGAPIPARTFISSQSRCRYNRFPCTSTRPGRCKRDPSSIGRPTCRLVRTVRTHRRRKEEGEAESRRRPIPSP
jgi:hypothetical protein